MLLTACGAGAAPGSAPDSATAADCAAQVRFHGAVYTGYGSTGHPGVRAGTADLADCQDVGLDPAGSVWPDDPTQVAVWSVRGYSSDEVLAVRLSRDLVEVFVADSLPSRERDGVLRAFTREEP